MPKSPLQQLSDLGQSVWIDYLSRDLLESGELARKMKEDAVSGVTSNPTIFQKAISHGTAYDEQLKELLEEESDPKEIFFRLAFRDIEDACDLMKQVWDEGRGLRGYVSMEVEPSLAYDTEGTYEQATRFHGEIDRPNLYVKIPGTRPGLPAIEDMIAAGKSINVTLLFALRRHAEVMEAYIRGLERLVAAGGDPKPVSSVASYFVSRVDTEADRRLDEIGGHDDLKGKLGVANAKLAYEQWQQIFSGERWDYLESKGASKQWCLWASTSTKNPGYSDVLYVENLIGPDTINTMPEETIGAFQDDGKVARTIDQDLDQAKRVFEQLAKPGVDYGDVTATLEEEGVQKFADSFDELIDGIRAKKGDLVSA